jgi:hypothetical protein
MWLKPNIYWYSLNPFTKVNSLPRFVGGNFKNLIHMNWILFPSASCPSGRRVADGFNKLLYNMALATF